LSHRSDFLVIGSGIAGLSFALEAAQTGRVTIVTKKEPEQGSTAAAQGGISAVLSPDDSIDGHVRDTLEAGAGLCDEVVVREVCGEGPEVIATLQERGVQFSRGDQGLELGREGGHSQRRIVHSGDHTGLDVETALLERIAEHRNIELLAHHFVVDLILDDKRQRRLHARGGDPPTVIGAWVLDAATGDVDAFVASSTVLATGGSGKVYLYTTNDDVSTGDGLAIAYRAGARISNVEFYQFHPTCLYHPYAKSFLISEAVRGEGGVLIGAEGESLMEGVHPQADLAPRDVVARTIDRYMKRTGTQCVHLDVSSKDAAFLRERFPTIHDRCLELGIDLTKEPIPVVPAAHYQCGGVVADLDGRTELPGLFAIGEVACTGLHGANRLASNSLLEGAVMGRRAAVAAAKRLTDTPTPTEVPQWDAGEAVPSDESVVVTQSWEEIRRFMWNYVGIFRNDVRLERARRRIALTEAEIRDYYWRFLVTPDLLELRNLAHVARMIIESALWRQESRGLHFSTTYPEASEVFARPSTLRRPPHGVVPELLP